MLSTHDLLPIPLDKNKNRIFLMPAPMYHFHLNRMFIHDTAHYATLCDNYSLNASFDPYLPMRTFFLTHLPHFLQFQNLQHPTLPYTYILPKQKAPLTKFRPIISYADHPMKKVLHPAGRALMTLFVRAKLPSFNINTTQMVTDYLKDWQTHLTTNPTIHPIFVSYDIENMYTELPHDKVLDQMKDFFTWCTSKFKTAYVSCHGHDVVMGHITQHRWMSFSFTDLLHLITYETTLNIFGVGADFVCLQKIGIAMGAFLSPAIAVAFVGMYEARALSTLKQSMWFDAIRFMDDILGIMYYPQHHTTCTHLTKHTYPSALTLKLVHLGNTAEFLETECFLFFHKGAYHVGSRWLNKNRDSLLRDTPLKILRYYPSTSPHTDDPYLKAMLTSICMKIDRYLILPPTLANAIPFFLEEDVSLLLKEFCALGYTLRQLAQHLRRAVKDHPSLTHSRYWRSLPVLCRSKWRHQEPQETNSEPIPKRHRWV
jgi:hypothetical protein